MATRLMLPQPVLHGNVVLQVVLLFFCLVATVLVPVIARPDVCYYKPSLIATITTTAAARHLQQSIQHQEHDHSVALIPASYCRTSSEFKKQGATKRERSFWTACGGCSQSQSQSQSQSSSPRWGVGVPAATTTTTTTTTTTKGPAVDAKSTRSPPPPPPPPPSVAEKLAKALAKAIR